MRLIDGEVSMRRIMVAALAAAALTGAQAQTLWQGAVYGMTREELAAAVPGVKSVTPTQERDGTITASMLEPVEIADCPFKASFGFQVERLAAVRLTCKTQAPSETDRIGKALLEALRAKYGAEISRERTSIGTQFAWFAAGTKVALDVIQIGSGGGLVNVYYGTDTLKDAAKL